MLLSTKTAGTLERLEQIPKIKDLQIYIIELNKNKLEQIKYYINNYTLLILTITYHALTLFTGLYEVLGL